MTVVTPSGNTVVERATIALLAATPEVTPHFSRSSVFGVSDPFPDMYDWDSMISAVRLLAHARPDIVIWNGSKGGSVGLDMETALVRRMGEEACCPATTSLFAAFKALKLLDARTLGFITPYSDAYQKRVETNFATWGFPTVTRANLAIADNLAYASVELATIIDMARDVARARPDVIVGWCTNFPSGFLADEIEAETGIPVVDATTVVLWQALRMLRIGTKDIRDWGRIFALD